MKAARLAFAALGASLCACQLVSGLSNLQGRSRPSTSAAVEGACTTDAGCTDADDTPFVGAHCEADQDCDGKTPRCLNTTCVDSATARRWSCTTDTSDALTKEIRYAFHVVDFVTREPPEQTVVKACRINDVACTEPVTTFRDDHQTGHVQLTLPTGFLGFFEVTSSGVETLLYVTEPITRNIQNRDLPILDTKTLALTAEILGFPYDETKGLALLEAVDCSESPQGGVHFESESAGDSFYLVDQVPNKEAQLTVFDPTNNTANGGFINVPTGFVQFAARLGTDGFVLGSVNVQIRPNAITFVEMHF